MGVSLFSFSFLFSAPFVDEIIIASVSTVCMTELWTQASGGTQCCLPPPQTWYNMDRIRGGGCRPAARPHTTSSIEGRPGLSAGSGSITSSVNSRGFASHLVPAGDAYTFQNPRQSCYRHRAPYHPNRDARLFGQLVSAPWSKSTP